ncbi:hypothetical protein PR003_g10705 [Phytophthora rubi]|uniref:Uncharacterized protein n=1 Tax=Phytophthora rubi TaxID=129364 RepID=A0A6A4FEK8_9STRA|nr:hypothetical protein PR003_g10705 [Phytophthora rubi]
MSMTMLARRLQQLRSGSKLNVWAISSVPIARNIAGNSGTEDWSDFNNVVKELRNISRENELDGGMPDTKLLKETGYGALVMAIRKKHGGMVAVAAKMGTRKDNNVFDVHKKTSARAKRRQKRQERLNKHDFY